MLLQISKIRLVRFAHLRFPWNQFCPWQHTYPVIFRQISESSKRLDLKTYIYSSKHCKKESFFCPKNWIDAITLKWQPRYNVFYIHRNFVVRFDQTPHRCSQYAWMASNRNALNAQRSHKIQTNNRFSVRKCSFTITICVCAEFSVRNVFSSSSFSTPSPDAIHESCYMLVRGDVNTFKSQQNGTMRKKSLGLGEKKHV